MSTKDSQDWLVAVTILYTDYYANKITLGELSDGVNSIVREHFLKEALETIGEDLPLDTEPNTGQRIHNKVKAELRNKFNDKYKED